jgi:1,4-dihydroxy-2-naphthoate octaprenyltransferase
MIEQVVKIVKNVNFKPALILLAIAVLIGFAVYYFTGFNWLTATIIFLSAVMINGLAVFSEDADVGGLDYEKGVTDTVEAVRNQKQAKRIQGSIICILFVLAILSYVFKWGIE